MKKLLLSLFIALNLLAIGTENSYGAMNNCGEKNDIWAQCNSDNGSVFTENIWTQSNSDNGSVFKESAKQIYKDHLPYLCNLSEILKTIQTKNNIEKKNKK
ncbi:MAG: hypothetical protein ABH827_05655 [bacterium]